MFNVACLGTRGRLPAQAVPHCPIRLLRMAVACLLFGLGAVALPVHAEGLYRCTGGNGEAVFTSTTAGYRDCHHLDVDPQERINKRTAQRSATLTTAAPAASPSTAPTVHQAATEGTARASAPAHRRVSAGVLSGAVYRVTHADGSIEYTNVPPRGGRGHKVTRLFTYIDTCVACDVHSNIDWVHVPLNLTAFSGVIQKAATDFGVSQALLRAIIHAESAYNPRAMSIKGAQGLMQLMPATASDMGVLDAFNATQNIRGGARYLAQLLKDFKGDASLAAAAYNAGPAAVQKYAGVPPYAETRVYVQRVNTLRKRYAAALGQAPLATR